MALLNSETTYRNAFYRAVGTTSSDGALVENSEAVGLVADTAISQGIRAAQQFLIAHGMSARWGTRAALTFTAGTAEWAGWASAPLPTDFLRLDGDSRRSALVDGSTFEPWGKLVDAKEEGLKGNFYFLRGTNLWVTRNAVRPTTLYLDYIKTHPEFKASVTLDFPEDAAGLAIAYAAQFAVADGWFPGDESNIARIARNVQTWEQTASRIARRARTPRKMTPPPRRGRYA